MLAKKLVDETGEVAVRAQNYLLDDLHAVDYGVLDLGDVRRAP